VSVLCDAAHPVPDIVHQAWLEEGPGSGWSIGWEAIEQRPIKRWSREAKSKVRQSNLRKRMVKRFPLFAEMFIASELASRPDYYEAADA
jgi:nitrate reductase beta subunit